MHSFIHKLLHRGGLKLLADCRRRAAAAPGMRHRRPRSARPPAGVRRELQSPQARRWRAAAKELHRRGQEATSVPYLDRPAGRISYHVAGNAGPALLLTHGYGATSAMFQANLAALSAGHQVVTWDLPGHGGSDSPGDPTAYSHAAVLADMAALLSELGHQGAVLGGHSLGGYLSLDFALHYPERVTGLVLIDTGPGFRNDAARLAWNERAHRTAARLAERGLAVLDSSANLHGGEHRDPAGLILAAEHTLTHQDARVIDGLPRIQVPALIVVGADDAAFLGAAHYMAGKISRAREIVIPDAGHAPNVDQPGLFDAEVSAFLAELPLTPSRDG